MYVIQARKPTAKAVKAIRTMSIAILCAFQMFVDVILTKV